MESFSVIGMLSEISKESIGILIPGLMNGTESTAIPVCFADTCCAGRKIMESFNTLPDWINESFRGILFTSKRCELFCDILYQELI
ncbi:hypothetical protein [Labilibaculum euxinus]